MMRGKALWTATVETDTRRVRLVVNHTPPGYNYVVFQSDKAKPKSKESSVEDASADSVEEAKAKAEEVAKNFLGDADLKLPAFVWKQG